MKSITADVTIVGGGITGLMLAKKLTDYDIRVVLVERNNRYANGPST